MVMALLRLLGGRCAVEALVEDGVRVEHALVVGRVSNRLELPFIC